MACVRLHVNRAVTGWIVYVTPSVALLSAALACFALYNARLIARQKATLDLIEKVESSEHYRATSAAFSDARRSSAGLAGAPQDPATRRRINDHLNHYELVALGIRRGVLDGRFYREWMGSSFVRDWNAAAPWIQRERWRRDPNGGWTYHAALFGNYERIACRWSAEAVRLAGGPRTPPDGDGGPGDDPLPVIERPALF